MRDGACALESHQPHSKRHALVAAGEQSLPLFGPEMGAERATLCGRDTKERWGRAEDGLQLPLAAMERSWEQETGCERRRFSRDVKATLQLPVLAAAHGNASGCMLRRQQVCFSCGIGGFPSLAICYR
jgi:hypothetical protein